MSLRNISYLWRNSTNYIMNKLEERFIEILEKEGFVFTVATKEQDYSGYDIIVRGQKIDLKAQTTNTRYPDTVLLSLEHNSYGDNWEKPKYLQRDDVYVWCFNGDSIIEFSPEVLHNSLQDCKTIYKSGDTDYFHREHKLAVVPKSLGRKILLSKEYEL